MRFGLTSEGGLNDALAFPFVYFGLYWLRNENWQSWIGNWVAVDLVWAIAAGIAMGILTAKAVMWIEQRIQKYHPVDELMEDFIALSLILIAYSLTEIVNGYGFLAVFVSGVTVKRSYHNLKRRNSQLEFTEKIEKLMEVGTILLLGTLLRVEPIWQFGGDALKIAGLLLFVIRPLGAWISTVEGKFAPRLPHLHPITRWLFGWFGIRGIGSLYYLSYALSEGVSGELASQLTWITYLTVVLSVILHGISSTPLMNWYEKTILPDQQKQLSGQH